MSSLNQFALSLYNDICTGADGENVFFSPLSIYTALSMVYAGSRGATAVQIKEVLQNEYDPTDDRAHRIIPEISEKVTASNKDLVLNLANNLWVQNNFKITDEFASCLKTHFEASPRSADFINNSENVRQEINKWVESKTNNKITDLIPSGALDPLTRLVLVNAIYFYGKWSSEFVKTHTRKRKFFIKQDKQCDVDMMYQNNDFKYIEEKSLDIQVLALPYKGSSTSLVVILPNQKDGLKSLQEKLFLENVENKTLTEVFSKLTAARKTKVKVFLPKFKIQHSVKLKEHLISLGLTDLFSLNDANLSGIAETNELYVSDAFHKAFIEVDEQGTKAAAATGMIMMPMCAIIRQEIIFNVDHPFLFFIYDIANEVILFMGKVSDLS